MHRALTRRRLDQRLTGMDERVGARPPDGWARTIRRALGMDSLVLARRLGVTPSRVRQLERAEAHFSIRLSTLRRVATALECELVYAFVPREPLEHMVLRQARRKAEEELSKAVVTGVPVVDHRREDVELMTELLDEQLDVRAQQLIDTHGLWRPASGQDQSWPPLRG